MTIDEVLGRIQTPEDRAFLEKLLKDQNSYITKLETQLKTSTGASGGTGADDITLKYLEKNMRKDVISEATAKIKSTISQDIYNAVEKDYLEFLDKNMDKAHTTVEYATDAFALVLGRCIANKDHPVNQIGKTVTPNGTPTTQPGNNSGAVQEVKDILAGHPPVMNSKDANAVSGIPDVNSGKVKSTKDAFDALRNKFAQAGGNKFGV